MQRYTITADGRLLKLLTSFGLCRAAALVGYDLWRRALLEVATTKEGDLVLPAQATMTSTP